MQPVPVVYTLLVGGTELESAWRPNIVPEIVPVFLNPSTQILGRLLKPVYDHSCNVIFPLS